MGLRLILVPFLLFVTLTASSAQAGAAAIQADQSFGIDGVARVEFDADSSDWPVGLAENPAGKVVVGFTRDEGAGAVAQFNRRGQLVLGFGDSGTSPLDFGSGSLRPNDLMVDRSSRILVAGQTLFESDGNPKGGIARLLPDGRPDPNFSGDGLSTSKLTAGFDPQEIALAPGGKILAVGPTSAQRDVWTMIVRYLPNGRLDRSFSGDGVATIVAPQLKLMRTVAVDRKGRVVVGGTSKGGGAKPPAFELARFKANGRLDRSFSRDGWARFNPNGPGSKMVETVRLDGRGRIIAIGKDDHDGTVIRVKPNGRLDRSFGTHGAAELNDLDPTDVVFNGQGHLVVVGNTDIAFGDPQPEIVVLNKKGDEVLVSIRAPFEFRSLDKVALGRQGRMLIAGRLASDSVGVARFQHP